ncbi:MAG: branched-chain amino acid ABC transporter permease [Betaproteobacteria bacterium]|nr:branched-chain amino acid ABC transporter permease [Betaproteobacteria bacterium]
MNFDIALLLAQDGITTGAIYALLALALVLVYVVTRVLFVPQGEFITYGALSLAALQLGRLPGIVWLLGGMAVLVTVVEIVSAARSGKLARLPRILAVYIVLPAIIIALTVWLAPRNPPLVVQILLSIALVVPLGPMLYRVAFQPLANASILVLLIVAVAVHFALQGLGLVFFGAEGFRVAPFYDARFEMGTLIVSGQTVLVLGATVLVMVLLYLFFEKTLFGKALRATAVNRMGARLVGISSAMAGKLAFTVAALIGALSGILIIPITTLYYDSGFLIGLKGFVAAVVGAVVSYPLAVAGAVLVGLLESFGSFWASAYKEAIVFTLLIPILIWRSLRTTHVEEEEEE